MKKYIFTTIFSLLSFSALADNNLPATNPAICLANNIYHEASTQPDAGQVAVGLVVLNRVKDSRYPNSICEVVYDARMTESWKTKQFPDLPDHQRKYYPKRHQCQFSCTVMVKQIRYMIRKHTQKFMHLLFVSYQEDTMD